MYLKLRIFVFRANCYLFIFAWIVPSDQGLKISIEYDVSNELIILHFFCLSRPKHILWKFHTYRAKRRYRSPPHFVAANDTRASYHCLGRLVPKQRLQFVIVVYERCSYWGVSVRCSVLTLTVLCNGGSDLWAAVVQALIEQGGEKAAKKDKINCV